MSVAQTVSQQANADGFYGTTPMAYSTPMTMELLYQIQQGIAGGGGGMVVTFAPANVRINLVPSLNNHLSIATPQTVYSVFGFNANANPQFIQLYDAAALPADGALPPYVLLAGGQQQFSWDFGPRGIVFSNGVQVCNSSTDSQKNIGALDCKFQIAYL